jgi:hypothetical protein
MISLIAIAASIGAVLAMRFNVLALVTTTILLLAIVALGLAVRGEAMRWIGVVIFATAASLQLGYFGASLLRIALPGKARLLMPISEDRPTDPEAPSLAPRHPDRDIAIEGG